MTQVLFTYILQCDSGWFGTDCSVPSVLSSIREWPLWLRPAQVTVPENVNSKGNLVNLDAIVEKKRPLLYVYDLPPDFNSLLLEVRTISSCHILSVHLECEILIPISFLNIVGTSF